MTAPVLKFRLAPTFPATVLAGDGLSASVSGGVLTLALDSAFLSDTYALIDGGNSFTGVQTITTNSGSAGLVVLSGSATLISAVIVGRATTDVQLGVAGSADQFFTGTVQADTALRGVSGTMFVGVGSNIGIKVAATGALTFPQHVSGTLIVNSSGALTANTETGTGNSVRATSPTLTTPTLGVASATSINKVAITAPASSATLTIADGKTVTHNATTTFGGTDGKALTLNTTGTIGGGDAWVLAIAAAKTVTHNATTTFGGTDGKALTINNTGTINGGDSWALAIAASKTLTVSNSLTFTGTDSTSFAFPSAGGSVVTADSTSTLTNKTFNSAGTGNVLQISGVTVSRNAYPGSDNDTASSAGNLGETMAQDRAIASATAMTTATPLNVTASNITLTAGKWLVTGQVTFVPGATTTVQYTQASISLTSATLDQNNGNQEIITFNGSTPVNGFTATIKPRFVAVANSSTQNVYLVANAQFAVSTLTVAGNITAIRIA